MKLYHIVATSGGGVIGKDNQLPWHFPADLKHFKKLTMGSTVIMGRKTFESIGKLLPGRENFVLSHSPSRTEEKHLRFFDSLDEALKAVPTKTAFIIGGADVFRQTIDQVDGIYLTRIEGSYEGDKYYPIRSVKDFKEMGFKEIAREKSAEDPRLEFILYVHGAGEKACLRTFSFV